MAGRKKNSPNKKKYKSWDAALGLEDDINRIVRSERMIIRCTPGFKEVAADIAALKSKESMADVLHRALQYYALEGVKNIPGTIKSKARDTI